MWFERFVAQLVFVAWRARLSGSPSQPWWYGEMQMMRDRDEVLEHLAYYAALRSALGLGVEA